MLGEGNVNSYDSSLKDDAYDTSKFTDIFTDNNSRIRKIMNEDDTKGSACFWWLRSAYFDNDYLVGFVYDYGGVGSESVGFGGAVLPVCLIG